MVYGGLCLKDCCSILVDELYELRSSGGRRFVRALEFGRLDADASLDVGNAGTSGLMGTWLAGALFSLFVVEEDCDCGSKPSEARSDCD